MPVSIILLVTFPHLSLMVFELLSHSAILLTIVCAFARLNLEKDIYSSPLNRYISLSLPTNAAFMLNAKFRGLSSPETNSWLS